MVQPVGSAFICAMVSYYLKHAGRGRRKSCHGPELFPKEASDLQQAQGFVVPVDAEAIVANKNGSMKNCREDKKGIDVCSHILG